MSITFEFVINTNPPSNHEEFVEQRKAIVQRVTNLFHTMPIGGSDLCKLLNIDYGSPAQLVPIHRGAKVKETVCTPFMQDGIKYEQVARYLWNLQNPYDPIYTGDTQLYITNGLPMIVSVDGVAINSKRIIEIKTLATLNEEEFTTRNQLVPYGIPLKYIAQLELYMDAYGYDTAVMIFLMTSVPGNREIYDQILEKPHETSEWLTDDVIKTLYFTREYTRPNLDLWFWILNEYLTFKEIVHDQELLHGTWPPTTLDMDLAASQAVSIRERELAVKEVDRHAGHPQRKRLVSIKGERQPYEYYWFASRLEQSRKMGRLLLERATKHGYDISWQAASFYVESADTPSPPPITTNKSPLFCNESLLKQ